MKVIQLTRGLHTVVDDDVYEWASKFKWHADDERATELHGGFAVLNFSDEK